MNFENLDSRTGGETATPMPIMHPATGKPLMGVDDKPCVALVKGTEAESYNAAMKALNTADMSADKADGEKTMWDAHEQLASRALHLITGFSENCLRDGKPMTAKDAEWWLNLQLIGTNQKENDKTFLMQTINHARDRKKHLGNDLTA